MSHERPTTLDRTGGTRPLGVAIVAGLLAGLARPVAGLALADVGTAPVELHHATAGLSLVALALHLSYSVGFGAVFVGGIAWGPVGRLRELPGAIVLLGLGYGLALWLVNVAVGWPLVQTALGPGVHEVPHLHAGPLLVHSLYGLVLGSVVAVLTR